MIIVRLADWIVCVALILDVIEGGVRKWVIGSESGAFSYSVYFSKDIVFAIILYCRPQKAPYGALEVFRRWLLIGCVFLICGAMVSALYDFNAIGALLTLRAVIFLPVVAFYAVKRLSAHSLRYAMWALAVLTLINCVLGIAQKNLPPDNVLNRYVVTDAAIVTLAAGVRATGTFAYITGLGVLSAVGIWAGLMLLSIPARSWHRIAGWASIAGGFGCGLASVSRATIVVGVGMVGCWIAFSRAGFNAFVRSLGGAGLACALALMLGAAPVTERLINGLQERMEDVDDTFDTRAFGQVGELLAAAQFAPLGNGLGSEQVGGNYYSKGELAFTNFEYQLPRLVMETGILGVIGFFIICAGAIVALQAAKRTVSDFRVKAALFATQLLLAPMFYLNVVFNHTASSFAWLIFAVVLAAVKIWITKPPPLRVAKK